MTETCKECEKPTPAGKSDHLTITLEDTGMDSGCVIDILRTCLRHAKVLHVEAYGTVTREYTSHGITHHVGDPYVQDLSHYLEGLTPEEGKC